MGSNPVSKLIAAIIHWHVNRWFLNRTHKECDFIGLNYYFPWTLGVHKNLPRSDMGWPIFPEGIYHTLRELARYKKPIYVTENGIADASDTKRASFIRDHVYWMHKALNAGVDVRGYFYWSLLDNFEWAEGFEKRFGLLEMDYGTLERRVRPSAYKYKKICESSAVTMP